MFLSEHERYPKCELRKWYIVRETTGSRRLAAMEAESVSPHVLFSSSTQEERDNEYGLSKREGRALLEVIEGDPQRGIAPMAPDLHKVSDLARYSKLFVDEENPSKGWFVSAQYFSRSML